MQYRWGYAAIGVMVGIGLGASVAAYAQPAVKRNVLTRMDVSGNAAMEEVIGSAEIPMGGEIGLHTHDGDELGYVVEGKLLLKVEGKPDVVVNAGEAYAIPRGAKHNGIAAPGSSAKVAAIWVVDKGKPLATPAK